MRWGGPPEFPSCLPATPSPLATALAEHHTGVDARGIPVTPHIVDLQTFQQSGRLRWRRRVAPLAWTTCRRPPGASSPRRLSSIWWACPARCRGRYPAEVSRNSLIHDQPAGGSTGAPASDGVGNLPAYICHCHGDPTTDHDRADDCRHFLAPAYASGLSRFAAPALA